jgi:hypothetical protein
MPRLRAIRAAVLSVSLLSMPVWGATTPSVAPLGTVIAADRAHVGKGNADVGTTLYGGDFLSTRTAGQRPSAHWFGKIVAPGCFRRDCERHRGCTLREIIAGNRDFLHLQRARLHALCF